MVQDLAQRGVSYDNFVTIQRDSSGAITALTTDMAALNLLRAQLVADGSGGVKAAGEDAAGVSVLVVSAGTAEIGMIL